MNTKNLDNEILKLIEAQPEISEMEIASRLSVPEELVKARISNFNDTRQKILIVGMGAVLSVLRRHLKLKIITLSKSLAVFLHLKP